MYSGPEADLCTPKRFFGPLSLEMPRPERTAWWPTFRPRADRPRRTMTMRQTPKQAHGWWRGRWAGAAQFIECGALWQPWATACAASKGAIESLVRSLALEGVRHGPAAVVVRGPGRWRRHRWRVMTCPMSGLNCRLCPVKRMSIRSALFNPSWPMAAIEDQCVTPTCPVFR